MVAALKDNVKLDQVSVFSKGNEYEKMAKRRRNRHIVTLEIPNSLDSVTMDLKQYL